MAAAPRPSVTTQLTGEEKQSLEAAWEGAFTAFRKAAGIDLKTASPPSADAIRASFDLKRSKDAEKNRKVEKAKEVFGKTMTCISRVGGIAASGASMVFGSPASIAGSALTFLIDAGLQYRKMFASIEDLLSQIVVVFERFQIYRNNAADLPPEMVRVAHKLLITVVDICGVCYTALTSNRLGTFGKLAFFSSDRDVQAQLERLKRIESEESKTQGALNLVLAAEHKKDLAVGFERTTEGLQAISGSVQGMQTELENRRDLKELKMVLSVPKEANYREQYLRSYNQLSTETGGNFCRWLQEDSVYQAWADANDSEHITLILSGEHGFGKTCTITAVIDDLAKRYPQQQQYTTRISVAYIYLSRLGKDVAKSEPKSEAGSTLSDIVRLLAWQVAQNDPFYLRDLTSRCKRAPNLGTTQDMWKHLFLDLVEQGATFYLIIDGTHELEHTERDTLAQLVQMLLAQPHASLCIKLFLAARSDFVKSLKAKLPSQLSEIKLASRTKSDIENHIRREANKMDIFQRQIESVKKLKISVCKGLAEAVGGSFLDASFLLREMSEKNDSQEVLDVLERAKKGDGVSGSIADMIKRCNRILSAKELQDLNTLLLWVMYAQRRLDLNECEAIILLQRSSRPLKLLENQIKDDFSGFLKLSPGGIVSLASENIGTYFKSLAGEQDPGTNNASKTVSKSEIKMVRNLIWNFCEDDVYERMGLATFFEQKLSESDIAIAIDCENAHALITIECLRVLTESYSKETIGICYYAGMNLVSHLNKIDLDGINPHYKGKIGPLLMTLLRESTIVDTALKRWWWFRFWAYGDDSVSKQILRLLRSSAVMKKVKLASSENNDWVNSVLESKQPEIELFRPMAATVIKLWLECESEYEIETAFSWIFGYFNLIYHTESPQAVQRAERPPQAEDIPASIIREIFEWAQTQTYVDANAATTLRNLGMTYQQFEELDAAIESLEAAIVLKSDYLVAYAKLGQVYAARAEKKKSNEWRKAIECHERVIEAAAKGQNIPMEGNAASWLEELQLSNAACYRNLKDYNAAEKIYTQLLEKDAQAYSVINAQMLMMCEQERWADAVGLIRGLENKLHIPSEEGDPMDPPKTCLIAFFVRYGWTDEERARLTKAFKKANELSGLKRLYRTAKENLEKLTDQHTEDSLFNFGVVAMSLAALLHYHAADLVEADEAIQIWESIIAMNDINRALQYSKFFSMNLLPVAYLTQALRTRSDEVHIDRMISKIQQLGGDEDDILTLPIDDIRSVIGRYFTAIDDAKHAREWLKPNVEVGLKLLSDDDVTNDYHGYRRLGFAFMDFGDLDNALASWTMIGPAQRSHENEANSKTDITNSNNIGSGTSATDISTDLAKDQIASEINSTSFENDPKLPVPQQTHTWQVKKELSGPLECDCAGQCGKVWTYPDDMFVCRECLEVYLDPGCLAKLRAGELERDICGKDHRFMHLPPLDDSSMDRIRAGLVRVGDKEIPLDDWLASIHEQWGIEDKSPVENS